MEDSATRFLGHIDAIRASGGLRHVARADEPGHTGMPRDASLLEEPRLIVALAGAVEFERRRGEGKATESLAPGQALFVPPGRGVRARARAAYTSMGIVFYRDATRFYLMQCKPSRDGHPGTPVETHVVPTGIGEEGFALTRLLAGREPTGGEVFFRHAAECLLVVARGLLAQPPTSVARGKAWSTWQAACDYLLEHLHRPVSRKDVARHLGVHPNHLSRLFAEFGDGSFGDFLLARRLERARLLLEDPRLNVAEVARLSGFASANYFARAFRARIGRTPTEERAERLKG